MFILRRVTKGSLEVNTCMGIEYVLVRKEENNAEFKERTRLWSQDDLKNVYGFVAFDGGESIMPLYKGSHYFVMASNGETFDNVSEKFGAHVNMSKVRAKFVCTEIEDQPVSGQKVVSFAPVISGSEENKSFAKYTPSGNLQMYISYETQASEFFEEGQEYYIDFTKAE